MSGSGRRRRPSTYRYHDTSVEPRAPTSPPATSPPTLSRRWRALFRTRAADAPAGVDEIVVYVGAANAAAGAVVSVRLQPA